MNIKYLPLIIFLVVLNLFAQNKNPISADSTVILSDSINTAIKDSAASADTSALLSKEKNIAKVDTLIPIYQTPLSIQSSFVSHHNLVFQDYRYTGDLFKPVLFSFLSDYGNLGHPDQLFIYGAGKGSIGFFSDGVLYNNRTVNYLDLNNIQSESIDSIEIIPSPRGFLYGPYPNEVSVNFITKDYISVVPYSRIKYYQGPFGEALADVNFNTLVTDRLNFAFDVTNRKFDQRYVNSGYGLWQFTGKLKYLLYSNVNLEGKYSYDKSEVGLNGGVYVDSISSAANFNSLIYDERLAPVYSPNRTQEIKRHKFNLRMLGKFHENLSTDLNVYYHFYNNTVRDIVDTTTTKNIDKAKVLGASLKQDYAVDIFKVQILANYEFDDLSYYSFYNQFSHRDLQNITYLSAAAVGSAFLFDSTLVPSFFYKYFHHNISGNNLSFNTSQNGFGFDVSFIPIQLLRLYLGYSTLGSGNSAAKTLEAGINFHFGNFEFLAKYFKRENSFFRNPKPMLDWGDEYVIKNISGIAAELNINIWKLNLLGNASYYKNNNSPSSYFYAFPKYSLTGGIYYKDVLFNTNLNLKTGFAVDYIGRMEVAVNSPFLYNSPSLQIDFTLAGEIQKVAMVYFAWENLLDEKYFIVPYYPMPGRGIRFGVAWELFN